MIDWRGGADAAALAGAGLEDRAVLRAVFRREADAAAALGAPALRVGDWPCPIPSPGCASAASTSDENQCKQNDPGAKDLHGADSSDSSRLDTGRTSLRQQLLLELGGVGLEV